MADNRRGKDKRYYFTLGQMVLLGAAFTLASFVIFFLGVFIGKGIEARKMVKPDEPLIKMPVKPLPQGGSGSGGASSKEELTFYDTLAKSRPVQTSTGEDNKNTDREKAPKRDGKQGKAESKRDAAPAPRKTIEKAAEKAGPPAIGAAAAQSSEAIDRKEDSKIWSVQVNAYPDERSAKQLVDRLKNKGYNAVVSETRNKGRVWYRVRVGKYGSRDEADQALETLKSKENLDRAFATSRP